MMMMKEPARTSRPRGSTGPGRQTSLSSRFPSGEKPTVVFTDRGWGFFAARTGAITPAYKASLEEAGLRAFQGESAGFQCGELGDILLHETAVAWLRRLMEKSMPAAPWKETRDAYCARLKQQCQKVNDKYDVTALCKEFPKRLQELVSKKGEKIGK